MVGLPTPPSNRSSQMKVDKYFYISNVVIMYLTLCHVMSFRGDISVLLIDVYSVYPCLTQPCSNQSCNISAASSMAYLLWLLSLLSQNVFHNSLRIVQDKHGSHPHIQHWAEANLSYKAESVSASSNKPTISSYHWASRYVLISSENMLCSYSILSCDFGILMKL